MQKSSNKISGDEVALLKIEQETAEKEKKAMKRKIRGQAVLCVISLFFILGSVSSAQGNWRTKFAEARQRLEQLLDEKESQGYDVLKARNLASQARQVMKQGQKKDAFRLAKEAIALLEKMEPQKASPPAPESSPTPPQDQRQNPLWAIGYQSAKGGGKTTLTFEDQKMLIEEGVDYIIFSGHIGDPQVNDFKDLIEQSGSNIKLINDFYPPSGGEPASFESVAGSDTSANSWG